MTLTILNWTGAIMVIAIIALTGAAIRDEMAANQTGAQLARQQIASACTSRGSFVHNGITYLCLRETRARELGR